MAKRFSFAVIAALVLMAACFGQSFPTVGHPGCGSGCGWSVISGSNVTFGGWGSYGVTLTTGAASGVTPRSIAGIGTQPYGVADLRASFSGGSAIQKTINAPSTANYRFNLEVFGHASCLEGGCASGVQPAYGYLLVQLDGINVTFDRYPVGTSISTTAPRITNSISQYASFTVNLAAGNHTLYIYTQTGTDSNNHPSGGDVALGQMLWYVYQSSLKANCGYTLDGTNWTNVLVTGNSAEQLATACENAHSGFAGTARRTNLNSLIVYSLSGADYSHGCGAAGAGQCELLDIE